MPSCGLIRNDQAEAARHSAPTAKQPKREAYINHFRALSFRYYGLNGAVPALYAEGALASLSGEVRTR